MYKYRLINLNDIINHSEEDIKSFLRFNGVEKFDECDVEAMLKITSCIDKNNRKGFNVSYNISRLDKEFDLVKIGNDTVVNIELKLTKKDVEQCKSNYKIFKQHYSEHDINIFCYECETNNIYIYNPDAKKLELTNYEKLNSVLARVTSFKMLDINININSIYMEPSFFLNKKYDLSNSQYITKGKILNGLDNEEKKILLISGRAGTGKTLLALDLMDQLLELGKDVKFLTPFKLNNIVDAALIAKYDMKTIKSFLLNLSDIDYVIIDEAQRLRYSDIEKLELLVNKRIILFGDINQNIDSESCFEELYMDRSNNEIYNMNQIIRTDDTFDLFAKKILNISTSGVKQKKFDKNKIEIEMLSSEAINNLEEYVYLEPGKSLYYDDCRRECTDRTCTLISDKCIRSSVPYNVIGREYDKVVIFFCDGFDIVDNQISSTKKICYGNLKKQLYSIITRCTMSLKVITNDITIYNFLYQKLEELSK